MDEQRVTDLEIRITHQEASIEELTAVLLARTSHRHSSRGRRDAAVTGGTDRKTAKA